MQEEGVLGVLVMQAAILATGERHLLSPALCCRCGWSHLSNEHLKALPEQENRLRAVVPRAWTAQGWKVMQHKVNPAPASPRPWPPQSTKDRNLPVMFFLLPCNYDSLLKFPIFNWLGKLQSQHRGEKKTKNPSSSAWLKRLFSFTTPGFWVTLLTRWK